MTHVVMIPLAILAAALQIGVLPELEAHPLGVPPVSIALIAGWCAMRTADATWPVLLITPLMAGALSEERTGWFLLALLPAAILGAVLTQPWTAEHARGSGSHGAGPMGLLPRLGIAALVASCGTVLYAAVLTLASGRPALLFEASSQVLTAATSTVVFALVIALVLWPLRPRARGLFA